LIDRAPEILSLALNRDKDFVDVPGIPSAPLSFFKFTRIGRSKLPTPLTNGSIRDSNATFGEKFFHLTKTEGEPMVKSHGVTDNFRGKTVTLIAGCFGIHHASLPNSG
jgi:hypothetical protein